MKSLVEFINEENNNNNVKPYIDSLNKDNKLSDAINSCQDYVNKLLKNINNAVEDPFINSQTMGRILEIGLAKFMEDINGLKFRLGKENKNESDIVCTSDAKYNIQLKSTSKNNVTFNSSKNPKESLYIFIRYIATYADDSYITSIKITGAKIGLLTNPEKHTSINFTSANKLGFVDLI